MTKQSTKTTTNIDDAQILHALQNDHDFFVRNPHLLVDIKLPQPEGNGTISLTTKQLAVLRDKLSKTEAFAEELISFGKQNDAINDTIHQLALGLLQASTVEDIQQLIKQHLLDAFNLAHASLQIFDNNSPFYQQQPDAFNDWVMTLKSPYCSGSNTAIQSLITAKTLSPAHQSFAVIPLFKDADSVLFGSIILSAEDAKHFHAEMGTAFLQKIGQLIATHLCKAAY